MTETISEIIAQMRRERRVRTGLEKPLPGKPGDPSPLPPVPLDRRLEPLLSDRQFKARLRGLDATELRSLLEEVDALNFRCSLHHRSALQRKAWRNRRVPRRRRAVEAAGRKAGRPPGAANFAARQYGLGLAMIWFQYTGRPPSRYASKALHGGYPGFVEWLVAMAPPRLRRAAGGEVPSVDYLVRTSIALFRLALRAPEEYRRRGLLDEQEWLRRP